MQFILQFMTVMYKCDAVCSSLYGDTTVSFGVPYQCKLLDKCGCFIPSILIVLTTIDRSISIQQL